MPSDRACHTRLKFYTLVESSRDKFKKIAQYDERSRSSTKMVQRVLLIAAPQTLSNGRTWCGVIENVNKVVNISMSSRKTSYLEQIQISKIYETEYTEIRNQQKQE